MTELDDYEIKLAASLYSVAENLPMKDVFEERMIKDFLNNFLLLRVSHKRQGRRELLEIAKSSHDAEESRMGRLKNIFGMGRN